LVSLAVGLFVWCTNWRTVWWQYDILAGDIISRDEGNVDRRKVSQSIKDYTDIRV